MEFLSPVEDNKISENLKLLNYFCLCKNLGIGMLFFELLPFGMKICYQDILKTILARSFK